MTCQCSKSVTHNFSQLMIQHPGGAEILLDVVGKIYKSVTVGFTVDIAHCVDRNRC